MTNAEKHESRVKYFQYISVAFTVVAIILAIIFIPKNIPLWQFTWSDIYTLLISLAVVATFIERAVEVIIKSWRGPGKLELQGGLDEKNLPPEIKLKRDIYTAKTKRLALLTAFAFGIAISVLGVRSLQPLVDPAVYKTVGTAHKAFFTGVDAFVTGALLGGGSDGMHKVMKTILGFFEKYPGK